MSEHAETSNSETVSGGGLKPHHVVILFGVLTAVVTVISGLASLVFDFHGDSTITRKVFGNVPGPLKLAFYTIIPMLIIWVSMAFANRMKNWQRGAPENRKTTAKNAKTRMEKFRAGVYMQTLLRDPAAGIMHSMIYFGFLVLMAVTITLEIDHQLPEALKFLHGGVYQGYSLVGDVAGIVFIGGIVFAMLRRWGPKAMRPYRIRIKSKPEHVIILVTFLLIGITGFGAEAFRIAENGTPSFEKWSIIGYPLATLVDGFDNLADWHLAWWVAHVLSFIAFLVILPTTMLRHMFTSPLNMYLSPRDRPKGAMKPMPNLMETELETFGASTIEDFTWKQLLDTDACTMCGRCTDVCPAHATGKPLDPREIVLKTGEVMAATGTPVVTPPIGVDAEIKVSITELFDRITSEEIWACTTCKACDENCPVNIEILDKILDMRRYKSLMESDFPSELGGAYRSMENSNNPWGMSQNDRAEWADDLEGIEIIEGGDPFTAEYLYWVGCAGSFDDKNKKVSQSFSKLMKRAKVDFAILGPSELCTGDPARRSGNEYIFQMLAMQNIETLDSMGVKKIVTQCPHCFNTLANEYPQLGGQYEVIHHSQLLDNLIDEGKLDVSSATLDDKLVYHDACYLGRHNDVYLAPRNVVGSIGGIEVVEAGRNGTKGMCCGGGGGRMWMEEHVGKQVNVERSQELIATGASRIATACPFCYIMIDDGVKGEGYEEDEVRVADISIHLLEAIEQGEAADLAEVLIPSSQRITADIIEPPLGFGMHGAESATPVTIGGGDISGGDISGGGVALAAAAVVGGAAIGDAVTADGTAEPEVALIEEPAVEEAAVEEAVVEAAPVSETPVVAAALAEETVAEETPVEETAVEEAVVEEAAAPQEVTYDETSPSAMTGTVTEAGAEAAPLEIPDAPAGTSDNLSLIKGTDPQIVGMLQARGITSYAQIASLDEAGVAALEQELSIPARIRRWNWVEQAKLLMEG